MDEFKAKLFIKGDAENIIRCFAPEDKKFDRSSFTITKKKDGVEFNISAQDAVAFRATINSVLQLLIVFEGVKKIGD